MMLPGGAANKLGNRYEKWWTVSEFVRMLHGATDTIRIEAPEVEKAEFVVTVGARQELHQVKRSHPSGKWSLASLCADGLLQAIGKQLRGTENRFVFASTSDARELADLCEAAAAAESTEEFKRSFLAAKKRNDGFERLLACWKCDVPTALDLLRRIEVHTIDERNLQRQARLGAQALFLADPGKTLAELLRLVEDSVHRTIRRQELRGELASRGYRLRHVTPERAGMAVENVTDRYLGGARRQLIQDRLVPRAAADTLLSRLDGAAATDSVMTGKAGAGKTACVVEVVERLRTLGAPVLAFRLDRVLSASTTVELGHQLGLEESPVLTLAAAAEAAGRPGVLVVDQLDAVSAMSGRSSGAFDLIEELLHEARGSRARAALHTVVVCRAFDWENDSGLRRLMPEAAAQVGVGEFPVGEVKTILTTAGFDAALFRSHQVALLRLPQNLSLLLDANFDTASTPTFSTATQLFDRYWQEKRRAVAERISSVSDHWMAIMRTLCDLMNATQQLSAPRECLDDFPPVYLDQLTSEGVLTFDGHRYGFGHESFFDYCFARVFRSRSGSLVSFLKGSDQHLFRRSQVRQVLAYLREADSNRYAEELDALLADDGIRPHLKDLAFALLAEVNDPTEKEWAIAERWTAPALKAVEDGTTNTDRLSAIAWQRIFGSRSWFAEVDRRGLIEKWLASDNGRLVDMVVTYLNVHQHRSPDRVAALLEPYADQGGEWTQRLRTLMGRAVYHTNRRFFNLLLRLVDNGTLDEVSRSGVVNDTFWLTLYQLGEKRPEWVPEVAAHRLRRRLEVIRTAGKAPYMLGNSLIGHDDSAARMIAKSAAAAPVEFVEQVLPAVLDISDSTLTDDEPPKRDAVWPTLIETEHPTGENACLTGLAGALAALAQEGAAPIGHAIAELRRRNTHVANYLLLALYGGAAERYADDAVLLLCAEPWRFQCGYSDSPNWCAMLLIRSVVARCTAANRVGLETEILRYVPPLERTIAGIQYKQIGHTKFDLLSAIPKDLRSIRANAHYEELKRKFREPARGPRQAIAGRVSSPIDKSAADLMTDDQWLRAIDKYQDRKYTVANPLKGGALELARVLETRVKEQPDRFARLGLKFRANANPVYLEHTLAGLKTAAVGSDLKLQVCRKAFAESPGPCGKAIADLLGSIEDPLPDDAVRILDQIATKHEDPASEAWKTDAGRGQPYYNGEIHTNGIHTTRGRAADAVRDLILTDPAYIPRFKPTIERMIRDRSAAVLSCVAGTLRAVAYHNRTLGVRLFRSMNLAEDRLLATHHVCEFIRCGLRDNFPAMQPIVERMLRSSTPEVREAGARMASLAALDHERAAYLVAEALRGDQSQRLGVAQVAAANLGVPECRAWCEAKLTVLFDDCVAEVREKAASCFNRDGIGTQSLASYVELITAFCDSNEFADGAFWLLRALDKSRERLPGMTCMVCERILDRSSEARDIGTGRYADVYTVAKLIFRTYQQHQNDEWASRSLDLIDRLCLVRRPEAVGEFEQFDR